jgi:hypothetical protein
MYQLSQSHSDFNCKLRNDLLVIASLSASVKADLPFVQTGFAKQLALLATFQEGQFTQLGRVNLSGIDPCSLVRLKQAVQKRHYIC